MKTSRAFFVDQRTGRQCRVLFEVGLGEPDGADGAVAAGIDGTSTPALRTPLPHWGVEYGRGRGKRGPATRWVDLKGGGLAKL